MEDKVVYTNENLRDMYRTFSDFCYHSTTPFIFKRDGKDDLVVMSAEMYQDIVNGKKLC